MSDFAQARSKLMFRLAVATASVTFLLILLGGIVWSTGSALACPDWPLCYGHFFPKMEGGVLYEHGHRLTVLVVSTLSVAMLVLALRGRSLQQLALTEIGLVVVQAIFGGLTVLLRLPLLVRVVHLGLSQLVFASTLLLAVRAFQLSKPGEPAPMASVSPSARRALALGAAFVYVQLLLGALVRHTGALMQSRLGLASSGSQIQPIIIGADARAVALAGAMQARGYDIRAIRPPTLTSCRAWR